MKATDLLEKQHRTVEDLFKRIEKSRKEDEKGELFGELAHCIVAHDAIEREIFYPACEKEMGMTDLLGEALVEHGVVEFMLYLADEAQGDDDFEPKITVLKESIEHHVKEEEQELFPKVEKALGAEMLEALGEEMEARFEEAKADDFRGPLHDNLRQVLEGATETVPESAKKAKKPTAKKTAKKTTRKAAGAAH
jgi:hemerythrin superfamily protein